MSRASDGEDVSERPRPAPQNWILLHPAVSAAVGGARCCVQGSAAKWCINEFVFSLWQYEQMKKLEVGDSEQLHAAFLVYMDLTEVRRWKDVSCVKSPELQAVLLEGREKEGAPIQTVFPLPVRRALCHKSLRHVLDRGYPMLLCAVASDSTLVYQRMTDGLVTPDPPVGATGPSPRRLKPVIPWQ
uniref:tRNA-splicing endonuclease subunit Sen15 domain-containing protein n=1 Tax=Scophthalmus maximus TaxID=52904 RepID=A0A8D3A5I5_SCOMX